jgi:hypothetical protein
MLVESAPRESVQETGIHALGATLRNMRESLKTRAAIRAVATKPLLR